MFYYKDYTHSSRVKDAVNLADICKGAVYNSCRCYIDVFSKELVEKHNKNYDYRYNCNEDLTDMSVTAVLKHFEICPCVTKDLNKVLGDFMTDQLKAIGIKPPSQGTLAHLFGTLSEKIHNSTVHTRGGATLIPASISNVEKRLLYRFFRAIGEDVMVLDGDMVRAPYDTEKEAPPTTPFKEVVSSTDVSEHKMKKQKVNHELQVNDFVKHKNDIWLERRHIIKLRIDGTCDIQDEHGNKYKKINLLNLEKE